MHEIQFPEEFADQIKDRLLRADFEAWADQVASARQCRRPVRLFGHSTRFDPSTGAATSFLDSRTMPDGVLYVRCGNRRASVCPSCSHEYKGDMWHLLSAGVAGGSKGVPESIATHPMVFATLTAPSFGPVHSASKPGSGRRCHPRASDQRCLHGRLTSCTQIHALEDPRVGEPICESCYDYDGHIIWQWWAPELWRRFTIATRRLLAARYGMSESRSREVVRLQFAKVAEFQKRGAVHFHALIRLDGAPSDDEPFPAPGVALTAGELADLVREAAQSVTFNAPPPLAGSLPQMLAFGSQVDARAVYPESASADVSPQMVAGYLAKYATKSVDDLNSVEDPNRLPAHIARLRRTAAELCAVSDDERYQLLAKWAPMLGFRGHFATKSRRFSTTLGALRQARSDHHRVDEAGAVLGDSTLVISNWAFAGMGWATNADAYLAVEATNCRPACGTNQCDQSQGAEDLP